MEQDEERQSAQQVSRGATQGKHSIIPITVTHPEQVDTHRLKLFRHPPWVLRLTIEGDRSYTCVKVVRAAPLSEPRRFISLLDARDEEICMLDDLEQVNDDLRRVVEQELARRYLTSIIERINAVRNEFGTSYWDVQTHRGPREFVIHNPAENAQWMGEHRLLLTDVDGNRFEVPRADRLDQRSVALIEKVL